MFLKTLERQSMHSSFTIFLHLTLSWAVLSRRSHMEPLRIELSAMGLSPGNILLCSWARYLTLTLPISIQDFKRELKQNTTTTATRTSLNKRFNEQNNRSARAICKITTRNDQILRSDWQVFAKCGPIKTFAAKVSPGVANRIKPVAIKCNRHSFAESARLDYQPLFGKMSPRSSPKALLGEERRPNSRERRKSSLRICLRTLFQFHQ